MPQDRWSHVEFRRIVNKAQHEALLAIKITQAARSAGLGLIVAQEAEIEIRSGAGAAGEVNILRPRVTGLKIQTVAEAFGEPGLQRVVAGAESGVANIGATRSQACERQPLR